MKALVKYLMSLGPVVFSKNGKGLMVFHPKSFDLAKLKRLVKATKRDFMVIDSTGPIPSFHKGKPVDPNVYVGPPEEAPTADEVLARLEAME